MNNKLHRICVLILAAGILLTGCGVNQTAAGAQVVNPVTEVSAREMTERTELVLNTPRKAENVHYYVISGEPEIAQVTFVLNGKEYTYRSVAAKMDAAALSGIYFGKCTESEVSVVKAKATLLTEGKTAVLYLLDAVPSISYTLSCNDCEDPAILALIAVELLAPVEEGIAGMVGIFKDDNENDVMLTESPNLQFYATVGLYRLASMDGTAVLTDDGVDMTLTDPSGGTMRATFLHNPDGFYTLTITDSTWSLLETGTAFEGFLKDSAG